MAKDNHSQGFKTRLGSITKIKSLNGEPIKMKTGQVIINKKATEQNIDKLVEINNDTSKKTNSKITNDGTVGGLLKGKPHYDKNGNPLGGIKVIVDNSREIEVEGNEFVVNEEASKKHWKELSKINQSAGNGVPINPPNNFDEDPETFKDGGNVIDFNPNKVPSKMILNYAKKIKKSYPEIWDLGGNIFGNEAFKNLQRVSARGYWLDSEEWMYIKWRSYVARHIHDFRIEGVIAMLKWVDKVEKGWPYMKSLIEEEIKKREAKKSTKMSIGGKTPAPLKDRIKGSEFNEKGTASTSSKAESIKFDDKTISSIQSLIDEHNEKYPSKIITLAVAKAVVRRGMGAYSSSHRPTITGGKPNSRTAWGLARLKAFIYKAQSGKSKSGNYSQDNDLFEELNISVQKMNEGGELNDCIDFIKNSEAIKNNGYYLEFKNLSIYIASGDKVPKIKSIFLITYNFGGQKNLKPIDTINSNELANKLANLLNVEIGVARLIVSEQITRSKRFEINKINSIVNKNIIIADRDTIVCTNVTFDLGNDNIKFEGGGMVAPNTEKLIEELKKYSNKTTSSVMTNNEGTKYVYHYWKLKYPHASNWLVKLFEKASLENTGVNYNTNFSYENTSFYFDRPTFKGHPNGTIQMKQLEILGKFEHGNSISSNPDQQDTITVDIPLMIRLLELSREDVHSDAELHFIVENLLKLKNKETLTMDDYAFIANVKKKHLNK